MPVPLSFITYGYNIFKRVLAIRINNPIYIIGDSWLAIQAPCGRDENTAEPIVRKET